MLNLMMMMMMMILITDSIYIYIHIESPPAWHFKNTQPFRNSAAEQRQGFTDILISFRAIWWYLFLRGSHEFAEGMFCFSPAIRRIYLVFSLHNSYCLSPMGKQMERDFHFLSHECVRIKGVKQNKWFFNVDESWLSLSDWPLDPWSLGDLPFFGPTDIR